MSELEPNYTYTETKPVILHGTLTHSDEIKDIAIALSKAQGEMKGAKKDTENPFYKSKYADLASVWEACRDVFAKNNLAVLQAPGGTDPNTVSVTTMLIHSSGQWFKDTLIMTPVKNDPQNIVSCVTYARRCSLSAFAGVAPEEDDGNAASGKGKTEIVKLSKATKDKVFNDSILCLEQSDEHGLNQIWSEFNADEQVVLWGLFNAQQRAAMKKLKAGK
jgi:hypothetical protein